MSHADVAAVRGFLGRVSRRLGWMAVADGVFLGVAAAAVLALAGWPARQSGITPASFGLLAAVFGGVISWQARRGAQRRASLIVEQLDGRCRNLLVTADELTSGESRIARAATSSDYVRGVVVAEAARVADGLSLSRLLPVRGRAVVLSATVAVWALALVRVTDGAILGPAVSATPVVDGLDVVVSPPPYTRLGATIERNAEHLRVLAGTQLTLSVRTNAPRILILTPGHSMTAATQNGEVATNLLAGVDGFVTIEPQSATGVAGDRRTLTVSIVPDVPPRVRIAKPAKDMVLPDGNRTLTIDIEAEDDIGLASLKLRYTRVTGSGERFTFKEDDAPITITRTGPRRWTAHADWNLASLKLEPGDLVVYRAIAADARPGSAPSESDAFIAEVAAPGGVAAGGYSVDPDQERYALSEQMVVLKTERLLAKKATMAAAAFADSAAEIGVEQRRVRAEFVFMLGGEVSDGAVDENDLSNINEEEEALGEADLLAGRQLNAGRIALLRAIREMSLASRYLTTADAATALAHEKEAVKRIESAFARSRIILRALAEREQLDSTRRLTGEMTELSRLPREALRAVPPPAGAPAPRIGADGGVGASRLLRGAQIDALRKVRP